MEDQKEKKSTETRELFGTFYLSESEFALPVTAVQEVVNPPTQYASVPLAPEFLLGLFNLRGTIIPVVDLRKLLRLRPRETQSADTKIAVVDHRGLSIGLLFDRTGEITRSQPEEHSAFEKTSELSVVRGVLKKEEGKRLIQILDVDPLFTLQGVPHQSEGAQRRGRHTLANQRGLRKQCISFRVGPARCALGIGEIQEILKIPQIDDTSLGNQHCIGVIDLRGDTVPVIDFASLLKYRKMESTPSAIQGDRRIVVMRLGDELFGLLVDGVDSIVSYYKEELIPFPVLNKDRSEMFLGCVTIAEQPEILLLDHQKILTNSEVSEITRGHSELYKSKAKASQQKRNSGPRRTFITFTVEQTYAVGIDEIQEIVDQPEELIQPPGLSKGLKGVLNLRGQLVTLVEARQMYSKPERPNAQRGKVLIFKKLNTHFGLIVDTVEAIISFSDSDKVKLPELLYKQQSGGMAEDVSEAIHFKDAHEHEHSLLILNPESIAKRVIRAA